MRLAYNYVEYRDALRGLQVCRRLRTDLPVTVTRISATHMDQAGLALMARKFPFVEELVIVQKRPGPSTLAALDDNAAADSTDTNSTSRSASDDWVRRSLAKELFWARCQLDFSRLVFYRLRKLAVQWSPLVTLDFNTRNTRALTHLCLRENWVGVVPPVLKLKLPHLQHLKLQGLTLRSSAGFTKSLGACPQLAVVDVWRINLLRGSLHRVLDLDLRSCQLLRLRDSYVGGVRLKAPQLRSLDLTSSTVGNSLAVINLEPLLGPPVLIDLHSILLADGDTRQHLQSHPRVGRAHLLNLSNHWGEAHWQPLPAGLQQPGSVNFYVDPSHKVAWQPTGWAPYNPGTLVDTHRLGWDWSVSEGAEPERRLLAYRWQPEGVAGVEEGGDSDDVDGGVSGEDEDEEGSDDADGDMEEEEDYEQQSGDEELEEEGEEESSSPVAQPVGRALLPAFLQIEVRPVAPPAPAVGAGGRSQGTGPGAGCGGAGRTSGTGIGHVAVAMPPGNMAAPPATNPGPGACKMQFLGGASMAARGGSAAAAGPLRPAAPQLLAAAPSGAGLPQRPAGTLAAAPTQRQPRPAGLAPLAAGHRTALASFNTYPPPALVEDQPPRAPGAAAGARLVLPEPRQLLPARPAVLPPLRAQAAAPTAQPAQHQRLQVRDTGAVAPPRVQHTVPAVALAPRQAQGAAPMSTEYEQRHRQQHAQQRGTACAGGQQQHHHTTTAAAPQERQREARHGATGTTTAATLPQQPQPYRSTQGTAPSGSTLVAHGLHARPPQRLCTAARQQEQQLPGRVAAAARTSGSQQANPEEQEQQLAPAAEAVAFAMAGIMGVMGALAAASADMMAGLAALQRGGRRQEEQEGFPVGGAVGASAAGLSNVAALLEPEELEMGGGGGGGGLPAGLQATLAQAQQMMAQAQRVAAQVEGMRRRGRG